MQIEDNGFSYTWHEQWATLPESSRSNGTTHGAGVLKDGRVVIFNQANPAVLIYDADANLLDSFGDYPGAHGLIVREVDGEERLLITDQDSCQAQVLSLDGDVILDLPAPPADAIANDGGEGRQNYIPTWLDRGPDGDYWIADGYGSWQVFRYDANGKYKAKIDGTEGAGRFNEPHGLAFSPDGELWITDRSNLRVCVYDSDGKYKRHSDAACHSPAAFAFSDGNAYVAEIAGGVKILDRDLNVLARLGDNPAITPNTAPGTWVPTEDHRQPGWPNVDPALLKEGHFHTPHGIAVGPDGSVYVVEWYRGGRVIKLEPAS